MTQVFKDKNIIVHVDIAKPNTQDFSALIVSRKNFDGTISILDIEMTEEKNEEVLENQAHSLLTKYKEN